MKILKSKLYILQKQKEEEELKNKKGEEKDIAWGSQIRSYVFQPYQLVKDHRTNYEMGNVQSVMDGNITGFLHEYLILKKNNKLQGDKYGKEKILFNNTNILSKWKVSYRDSIYNNTCRYNKKI